MKVDFQFTFIFSTFTFIAIRSQGKRRRGNRECSAWSGNQDFEPDMSLHDIFEESAVDQTELRGTRIAPASTLLIGTALLTQVMVLSSVAIIMGVAVVTMCALVVELLVLAAVAAVLERGLVETEDLGSLMEIIATLFITVVTVVLASIGGGESSQKPTILDGYPVAALKL